MIAPDPFGMAADILQPEPDPLAEEATRVATDLRTFARAAWPVLEPQTTYLSNWHIDLICEYLELVYAREITRLIINEPPRYMKSNLVSVLGPVWRWIHAAHERFLFSSYAASLSTKHSIDRRTIMRSDWFLARFPHVRILTGEDIKTEFSNSRRGTMIATSMKGVATGKGGDHVVVDDPQDPKRASSTQERESINTLFDQTLSQRLDDKRRGTITVVMQRLHEQDLTGHLLEKGGWELVKLPGEAPRKTTIRFPKSGREVVREPGEPLWPEREGLPELAQARTALGARGYAGQYDQDPAPAEGDYFKRLWWRFWKPEGLELPAVVIDLGDKGGVHEVWPEDLPPLGQRLQSWDMAFKKTTDTDFVVGQIWGAAGSRRYLLDQVRDRMSFTESLDAMRRMSDAHPDAVAKLVEDKANGPAVIDVLKVELVGLIGVEPEGGKEARAAAVSPQVEAHNVYLPHPALAPWVFDLIEEAATFPNGANDDQVDALTQALLRMLRGGKARTRSPVGRSISAGGAPT